jgi:hypothetical protein
MAQPTQPRHQALAEELAASLAEAAERLNGARDATAFRRAIDAHDRAWHRLRQVIEDFRPCVPKHFMDFSCRSRGRGPYRLNDDDVEALIHIDRIVAAAITRSTNADG